MTYALVLNSGSSSIKFQILDPTADAAADPFVSGLVEQIGEPSGNIVVKINGEKYTSQAPIPDHSAGLEMAFAILGEHGAGPTDVDISAVGHRVVHGGKVFSKNEAKAGSITPFRRWPSRASPVSPACLFRCELCWKACCATAMA